MKRDSSGLKNYKPLSEDSLSVSHSDCKENSKPKKNKDAKAVSKNDKVLNEFLSPVNVLNARNKTNLIQTTKAKSNTKRLMQPKHFAFNLQMKETQQERRLANFQKYQQIWHEYENKVDKHFIIKEQIKSGKFFSVAQNN